MIKPVIGTQARFIEMPVVERSDLDHAVNVVRKAYEDDLRAGTNKYFKIIDTPFGDLPLHTSYKETKRIEWWQDLTLLRYCVSFDEDFPELVESFGHSVRNESPATFSPEVDTIYEELFLRITKLNYFSQINNAGNKSLKFNFLSNNDKISESIMFIFSMQSKLKFLKSDWNINQEALYLGIAFWRNRHTYMNIDEIKIISARNSFMVESSQIYLSDYDGNRRIIDEFTNQGYAIRGSDSNLYSTLYGCLTLGFFIDAYICERNLNDMTCGSVQSMTENTP